jgi:hypothetical protein
MLSYSIQIQLAFSLTVVLREKLVKYYLISDLMPPDADTQREKLALSIGPI